MKSYYFNDIKYAKPYYGIVWVVTAPDLKLPLSANKTVYLSCNNISDEEIEILNLLIKSGQVIVLNLTKPNMN
jgi:hypothetical protein